MVSNVLKEIDKRTNKIKTNVNLILTFSTVNINKTTAKKLSKNFN